MIIGKELDYYVEINKNLRFAVVTVLFVILKISGMILLNWWWIIGALAIDTYLIVSAGLNILKGSILHNQALVKDGIIKEGEGIEW